jgi:hypothetical protein
MKNSLKTFIGVCTSIDKIPGRFSTTFGRLGK